MTDISTPPLSTADPRPLGRILWRFRRELAVTGLFSGIANLLMLTPTLYMLQVFDRVMISNNGYTLAAATAIMLALTGLMAFAEWIRARLLVRTGVRIDRQLSTRVFESAFHARLARREQDPAQALADLNHLRQFITGNGVLTFFDMPWALIYLAVLYMMHPVLGHAGVVFSLLLGGLAWWGYRSSAGNEAGTLLAEANGYLGRKLVHVETVHAMGMLGSLRKPWLALHGQWLSEQTGAQMVSQRFQVSAKFMQYLQQAMILSVGALLTIRGELTLGAMVASNMLMGNALRPVNALVGVWRPFMEARQAYRRLQTLLTDSPVPEEPAGQDRLLGAVTLLGLGALVPVGERTLLRTIDLHVEPGQTVAIVGPSGAGKSTLVQCLLGLWPRVTGEVLFDGEPLAHWSRRALGPQIGYLPQDIQLFEGSVAENICRLDTVNPALAVDAAQLAGVHEVILGLPKGYDTPVGAAGLLLSGGQRQRIGLARALYGKPRIVVLDEPNAHLDDTGEATLVRAIGLLRSAGTTIFLVTHNLKLLSLADRVIELRAGSLVNHPATESATATA